jgi:hypothetical protein
MDFLKTQKITHDVIFVLRYKIFAYTLFGFLQKKTTEHIVSLLYYILLIVLNHEYFRDDSSYKQKSIGLENTLAHKYNTFEFKSIEIQNTIGNRVEILF